MTREPRWQDAAACFGFDPDLWFAERRGEGLPRRAAA